MKIILFLITLLFSSSTFSVAETIILKNGTQVIGKVIDQIGDEVKVETDIGFVSTYYKDEIIEIRGDLVPPRVENLQEDSLEPLQNDGENLSTTEEKQLLCAPRLLDGEQKLFDKFGTIQKSINYKDGQLDGPYVEYYENGNVNVEINVIGGAEQEILKDLYEKSADKRRISYINGVLGSDIKIYYSDGTLKEEYDDENGIEREYEENGKLLYETVEQDDESAILKFYNDQEISRYEMTILNDIPNGIAKTFNKEGNTSITTNYHNWVRQGEEIFFDQFGKEIVRIEYVDGQLNTIEILDDSYLK